jgi:hypothetical protein
MAFESINKNNYGVFAVLFLVLLLSQSRVFNFLFVTALGRAILILFILGISYISKILGTVLVLFIIILFNNSNIDFLEGYSLNSMTSQNARNNTNLSLPGTSVPTKFTNSLSSKEIYVGSEGFNIIDRENTILRGKNSNQIPIFTNSRVISGNIEPSDSLVFSTISSRF